MTNELLDKFNSKKELKNTVVPFLKKHGCVDSQVVDIIQKLKTSCSISSDSVTIPDISGPITLEDMLILMDFQNGLLKSKNRVAYVLNYIKSNQRP